MSTPEKPKKPINEGEERKKQADSEKRDRGAADAKGAEPNKIVRYGKDDQPERS